jgi:hypothetical protein
MIRTLQANLLIDYVPSLLAAPEQAVAPLTDAQLPHLYNYIAGN